MDSPVYRSVLLKVRPLFDLGSIRATPRALTLISLGRVRVLTLLARHVSGDWGTAPPRIVKANELALSQGGELISIYNLSESEAHSRTNRFTTLICLVTESDRSVTTFLVPEEY